MAQKISKFLLLFFVPCILALDSVPVPRRQQSTPTSSVSTQSGPLTTPISNHPFTPFPTPTLHPEPPVFRKTDPLFPPPVSPNPVVVLDFAPAWSIAYSKAQELVGVNLFIPHYDLVYLITKFGTYTR
ncbi:hypothetical protein JVU11DRAFT_9747 [Chiua virens]|nr:hypothetical protein JVU11DRAFT_9747 [Chiua virens]